MIDWPLEDVAASVADIKVPHPCILYLVYFENSFEPFQYFFNLLLISIIILWYISYLGRIWLKYFRTICNLQEERPRSASFSSYSTLVTCYLDSRASSWPLWSARYALLRSLLELSISSSQTCRPALSAGGRPTKPTAPVWRLLLSPTWYFI